jgi:transposase-like protein
VSIDAVTRSFRQWGVDSGFRRKGTTLYRDQGEAPAYRRVLDELIPSALHTVEQYANNPIESDHGRLKSRLRPMRGLKRQRSVRIIATGHAFVQNLRRGHYEIATD